MSVKDIFLIRAQPKLTAKLFVATPMYGGMCTGMYTSGIMQLVGTCGQNGIQMYYSFMMNESSDISIASRVSVRCDPGDMDSIV